MPTNRKRISQPARPTIWQALNEPVVEVTESFARGVSVTALVIFIVIWVAPHWDFAKAINSEFAYQQFLSWQSAIVSSEPRVAGVQVAQSPIWYEVLKDLPEAVPVAFGEAASEVLDISGPVQEIAEFYQPGFEALEEAWLELMADPS